MYRGSCSRTYLKIKLKKSKIIKEKIQKLKNKNANHIDSNEFAIEIGKILSEAFTGEIRVDLLPDNRIYYNIAKRIIEPNLKRNYDIVGDYSRNVQEVLNKKSNISLKAIKADLNQDRIDGIVNKISGYNTFEDGKWLLEEPIINFTQAIVDDTIKTNAEFQYKSGLRPKIIRKEAGNCCKWCKDAVGVYEYPDVPKDVYRRHQRCRCTVDYLPGNNKKQDVWTKKWTDIDKSDKIEERNDFSNKHKFKINNKQFGKKSRKHMRDFKLDASLEADRKKFIAIIYDIVENNDRIIRNINWRGQTDPLIAYVKGDDVVLANKNNEFVTILRGGVNNARIKNTGK
ncbi:hypothetical protein [Citroniella saccharovorans]|uniref:hypothetical protein n=1 Tax=Citroniella saccharovorans TaxID=2053367 RepID=UPI002D7A1B8C|nr:hypothetical protein [Citroniella saccharovorans]